MFCHGFFISTRSACLGFFPVLLTTYVFVYKLVRFAWTIAECMHCHNHLGWRFTAVKKGLSPSKFWGLTRASLKPGMKSDGDDQQPESPPATHERMGRLDSAPS
jgi:hypothetical protein